MENQTYRIHGINEREEGWDGNGWELAERTDETEVLSRDRLPADPGYGVHSAKNG